MQVNTTIIDPKRLDFELSSVFVDKPVVRASFVDKPFSIEVHDADDEQIATAYDTGMVDAIRVIVDREDSLPPFLVFDVSIPGVDVAYYWQYHGAHDAGKIMVLVMFGEMLHAHGADAPIEKLKRLAGVADE